MDGICDIKEYWFIEIAGKLIKPDPKDKTKFPLNLKITCGKINMRLNIIVARTLSPRDPIRLTLYLRTVTIFDYFEKRETQ